MHARLVGGLQGPPLARQLGQRDRVGVREPVPAVQRDVDRLERLQHPVRHALRPHQLVAGHLVHLGRVELVAGEQADQGPGGAPGADAHSHAAELLLQEGGPPRGQPRPDGADAQRRAARVVLVLAEQRVEVVHPDEHAPGGGQDDLPVGRRPHTRPRPLEQRPADRPLDPLELGGQRGLGEPEPGGGLGEAAGFRDRLQHPQVADLQRHRPVIA
nr:hypothetical protein GCM10020241_25910 [Streptoalloteichus tenebrarius]